MAVGDFWYNSDSGMIDKQTIPGWLGWHGPFKTEQAARDYYSANKDKNPGWKPPTTSIVDSAAQFAGLPTSWLPSNIETLFVRIGEVLIGLVLIGIGLAHLTGAGNFVSKAVRAAV